ncbi:class I SAM-dependent methyltransferase [Flagellimonas pacifica]|uniref:Methyltransferase domain-containing protein n=1 Tax=Flagellimonas pacifica TaxID=1247520 RepID=A0A285MCU6_9FLAO|nr:class I SAM-dependent methyltransferase [Allomuricauda parva]SNY95004.1 Methyltransferase domain-containing protein [Allomuricauda parva]
MKLFLKTKDFSVSKENFELLFDTELEMLVTHPKPDDLASYYESQEYISHTDSKASLTDRLYQWIKRYSIKKKIQLIDNQSVNPEKLLDFGAGTGDFLAQSKSKGFKVSGIEPNEKARAYAAKKGVPLFKDSTEIQNEIFDVITLWHVLEHLPNLDSQVKELNSLLDLNGTLIVAVPNYKSFDAKHYGAHWAAYDVPRHLWHFSKTSIIRLFDKHNMEVVSIKPMIFDAFYVSLLSEKYKGNMLYLSNAFFVGLWSNFRAYFSKEYSSLIYIIKKKN